MQTENMSFGSVLNELKGDSTARAERVGWNGKGMFVFPVCGNSWDFTTDVEGVDELDTDFFLCMKTAGNSLVPWVASQSDIIATDWRLV